jgi:GDP-4-dehydro-6-deoxy-D-mannose reductase
MDPVREFIHVADVVQAYTLLIELGTPSEIYNVACGRATSVRDLFFMLSDALEHRVIPEEDPDLIRPVDIPYLVGDSTKLRDQTGWEPAISLEQTIREIVDAEAN